MPRRARKTGVTGVYHVMLRGVNRNVIFHDGDDIRLELLSVGRDAEGIVCAQDQGHIHVQGIADLDLQLFGKNIADPQAMHDELVRIFTEEDVKKIGQNARETIPLSWEKLIPMVLDRYQTVIDRYERTR